MILEEEYSVLVVHPHRAFDAHRQKTEKCVVHVDHFSADPDMLTIINCGSMSDVDSLMSVLDSKDEVIQRYYRMTGSLTKTESGGADDSAA